MTGSIIYINDICNQNCVFCCGIGKKMSKDKYKPIIDKAKRRLIISGGEPPISKDLSVILKLSKENKNIKEIELQSNHLNQGRYVPPLELQVIKCRDAYDGRKFIGTMYYGRLTYRKNPDEFIFAQFDIPWLK